MEELNERKIPLDVSFNETIKQSNLASLTGEITESFIDSVLNDGVLKEIPIVSSILSLNKAIVTIKDRLFLKKIISFFIGIKHIDAKKRAKFIDEINEDNEHKIKVGDKLMYILDQCDDHLIAQYIAQLFCVYLEEKISYSDFVKGSKIIQSIYLKDLEFFLTAPCDVFARTAKAEEAPHEEDFPFINVGLIGFGNNDIRLEFGRSWNESEKYYLSGGDTIVYFTSIGRVIRENLTKI